MKEIDPVHVALSLVVALTQAHGQRDQRTGNPRSKKLLHKANTVVVYPRAMVKREIHP